jgi:hypothetical protein
MNHAHLVENAVESITENLAENPTDNITDHVVVKLVAEPLTYFVEILSRSGEVEHRYRLDQLPIQIGRGYQNHVILEDEHVAANHAVIERNEEGTLQIRDLASHNGLVFFGRRQSEVELNGNSVVRLGQTHIRVRLSDFEVTPEVIDRSNYQWEGWRPALVGFLAISFLAISTAWLAQLENFSLLTYLQTCLSMLSVGVLWSGIWAAANRLFARHPRFGRHLFIAACAMVSLQAWESISSLLAFMFSWEVLTRYGNHIEILIICITIYFHLCTLKRRYPRKLLIAAFICSALGSGLLLMSRHKNTGGFSEELYMGDLFNPALRVSGEKSADAFIDNAAKLKAQVERERQKAEPDVDAESD